MRLNIQPPDAGQRTKSPDAGSDSPFCQKVRRVVSSPPIQPFAPLRPTRSYLSGQWTAVSEKWEVKNNGKNLHSTANN